MIPPETPQNGSAKTNKKNRNGKTSGISLPSSEGQTAVIRKAMARSGLSPSDITYVECHGTGTKVGDAIELDGLANVFQRSIEQPLYIGSVKSNVGHSEAASGISSVVKATLALENGRIPPTYGLKNVNPKLKLDERNFKIPTETIEWPDETRVRRIGINSFGYGTFASNAAWSLDKKLTYHRWRQCSCYYRRSASRWSFKCE